jgi:dienelactone hydrolase
VILLHGYTAVDPRHLQAWIDHLVRQGRVVIHPDYQVENPLGEQPLEYTGNMLDGVTAALDELRSGRHVPTTTSGLAVAGYSMGGILALNYAAMAESLSLPAPSSVLAVTPGGCRGCHGPGDDGFGVPYRDLSRIQPDTKLLLVVGEDDDFVGSRPAVVAWEETGQIPDENRDLLVVRSDDHGEPPLVADHSFPSNADADAEVDALDWRGTFKWLDGLTRCVDRPSVCAATMNGGATQLDMGAWSDGTPVIPPRNVASL